MKLALRIATCCTLLSTVSTAMSETAAYPVSGSYGTHNLPQFYRPGQVRDYPAGTMDEMAQAGRYRPAPVTRYSDSTYYPPRGGNYPEGFEPYTWRQQPDHHRFRPWRDNEGYPTDGEWRFRSQPAIDYPDHSYRFQQYQPRQRSFQQPYLPGNQRDYGQHRPQSDWGYSGQPYAVPGYQRQVPQGFGYPRQYQERLPYPEAYMPYQEYMPYQKYMPFTEQQIPFPEHRPYEEHWGGGMDPYYGMDWEGGHPPPPANHPGFPHRRGSMRDQPYPMPPDSGDWSSPAPQQGMPTPLPGEAGLDQLPLPPELDAAAAQTPAPELAEPDAPAAAVTPTPEAPEPTATEKAPEDFPLAAPEAPAEEESAAALEAPAEEESAAAPDATETEQGDPQPQAEEQSTPTEEPAEAKET